MQKYPIGFQTKTENPPREVVAIGELREPKKSVAQVYFASRKMTLAYYNELFDLRVGDIVFVDGKLEGHIGRVVEVSYTFKIRPSDYKRVIAVADTAVSGRFYQADSHLLTFERDAIPYNKVRGWFLPPRSDEEYVSGIDDGNGFPLNELSLMEISPEAAEAGHRYYMNNNVVYLCLDSGYGRAIVEGREYYEVEFTYRDGEIGNLLCSGFCGYACKHEFAAILQLKESLEIIDKDYSAEYSDYFAALSKPLFISMLMDNNARGRISLNV